MNILFLSLTFPDCINPERGIYNLGLCAALARHHRVHAIAPRGWHEWLSSSRDRRAYRPSDETVASGVTADFPIYWYLPKVMPAARGRALWQSIRGTANHLAKSFRPDVVLSYWAYPDGDAGCRAATHFGVPSIVIVGGSDVLILPNESGHRRVVVDVLRRTTCVATVSDGLRRATVSLGVPECNVRTIRQGIDPVVFHPGDRNEARRSLSIPIEEDMLLWVGRMVSVKNLDMLIDAVARARRERPGLRLHLVGSGESRAALEARVSAENLEASVRFEGAVAHDRLPIWYRAANVTVLTSHSEGLPNVLRETQASGTPFVATDVGDIREIAAPGLSRLTPAGDTDAFARAIVESLSGRTASIAPDLTVRTWSDCAREFTALFDELRRNGTLRHAPTIVGNLS